MRYQSGSPTSVYPWIHNKTRGLNDTTVYMRNETKVPFLGVLIDKSNQNTTPANEID